MIEPDGPPALVIVPLKRIVPFMQRQPVESCDGGDKNKSERTARQRRGK